jgi:hypothetical protein
MVFASKDGRDCDRGESVTVVLLLFSLRLAVFIACAWGFWFAPESATAPLPFTLDGAQGSTAKS